MSQMLNGEKCFSVKEAAALMGVHHLTVYRWIELRRISFFRISERKTLIPENIIRKYIDEAKVRSI